MLPGVGTGCRRLLLHSRCHQSELCSVPHPLLQSMLFAAANTATAVTLNNMTPRSKLTPIRHWPMGHASMSGITRQGSTPEHQLAQLVSHAPETQLAQASVFNRGPTTPSSQDLVDLVKESWSLLVIDCICTLKRGDSCHSCLFAAHAVQHLCKVPVAQESFSTVALVHMAS